MDTMANEQYRARATELLDQSKLEQDSEVAAMLETVAECFRALADVPTLPLEFFDFPRKNMFPHDPYKK